MEQTQPHQEAPPVRARAMVLRPRNAEKAIKHGRALVRLAAQSHPSFSSLFDLQPYVFVGFVGTRDAIVDEAGRVVGVLEPGDSFAVEGDHTPVAIGKVMTNPGSFVQCMHCGCESFGGAEHCTICGRDVAEGKRRAAISRPWSLYV